MSQILSDRMIVGPARTVKVTLSSGDYFQILALETYSHTAAIGSSGSGDGNMDNPHGLDIYETDQELWVADTANDRIGRFNLAGTWQGSFGSSGTGNNQYDGPEDLAVASDYAYVVDSQNRRIQKINSVTKAYDSEWAVGGGDRIPYGIALDASNSLLYVAIYISATTGEIRVYNLSGVLQDTWEFSTLAPISVDVNSDGTKILIGTANGYAFIYNASGAFQYNVGVEYLGASGEVRGYFHAEDTIYLVEKDTSQIVKTLLSGRGVCLFGREGSGNGETDDPSGFVQYKDHIYISDNVNDRVVKMTSPTKTRAKVFRISEDASIEMLGAAFDATTTTIGSVPEL